MAKSMHTPGEWRVSTRGKEIVVEVNVAPNCDQYIFEPCEMDIANAQRTVDCVNALDGINPASVKPILEKLATIKRTAESYGDSVYYLSNCLKTIRLIAIEALLLAKEE